jgi:hypothetical protein
MFRYFEPLFSSHYFHSQENQHANFKPNFPTTASVFHKPILDISKLNRLSCQVCSSMLQSVPGLAVQSSIHYVHSASRVHTLDNLQLLWVARRQNLLFCENILLFEALNQQLSFISLCFESQLLIDHLLFGIVRVDDILEHELAAAQKDLDDDISLIHQHVECFPVSRRRFRCIELRKRFRVVQCVLSPEPKSMVLKNVAPPTNCTCLIPKFGDFHENSIQDILTLRDLKKSLTLLRLCESLDREKVLFAANELNRSMSICSRINRPIGNLKLSDLQVILFSLEYGVSDPELFFVLISALNCYFLARVKAFECHGMASDDPRSSERRVILVFSRVQEQEEVLTLVPSMFDILSTTLEIHASTSIQISQACVVLIGHVGKLMRACCRPKSCLSEPSPALKIRKNYFEKDLLRKFQQLLLKSIGRCRNVIVNRTSPQPTATRTALNAALLEVNAIANSLMVLEQELKSMENSTSSLTVSTGNSPQIDTKNPHQDWLQWTVSLMDLVQVLSCTDKTGEYDMHSTNTTMELFCESIQWLVKHYPFAVPLVCSPLTSQRREDYLASQSQSALIDVLISALFYSTTNLQTQLAAHVLTSLNQVIDCIAQQGDTLIDSQSGSLFRLHECLSTLLSLPIADESPSGFVSNMSNISQPKLTINQLTVLFQSVCLSFEFFGSDAMLRISEDNSLLRAIQLKKETLISRQTRKCTLAERLAMDFCLCVLASSEQYFSVPQAISVDLVDSAALSFDAIPPFTIPTPRSPMPHARRRNAFVQNHALSGDDNELQPMMRTFLDRLLLDRVMHDVNVSMTQDRDGQGNNNNMVFDNTGPLVAALRLLQRQEVHMNVGDEEEGDSHSDSNSDSDSSESSQNVNDLFGAILHMTSDEFLEEEMDDDDDDIMNIPLLDRRFEHSHNPEDDS